MDDHFVRMPSGIPGLDEMIEGGLPFPSTILVAGGTGTGKTTFALQFLSEGAKRGEQCLFFTTFSEPTQWMLRFASRYTFLDKEYFGGKIKYVELGPVIKKFRDQGDSSEKLIGFIENSIMEVMPQRIVIDPITIIGTIFTERYREFLYDLSMTLKNWQAVTILTGEVLPDEPYPMEVAYTADGIILLYNHKLDEGRRRYLEVLKMRGTNHTTGWQAADLTADGYKIHPGLQ